MILLKMFSWLTLHDPLANAKQSLIGINVIKQEANLQHAAIIISQKKMNWHSFVWIYLLRYVNKTSKKFEAKLRRA